MGFMRILPTAADVGAAQVRTVPNGRFSTDILHSAVFNLPISGAKKWGASRRGCHRHVIQDGRIVIPDGRLELEIAFPLLS